MKAGRCKHFTGLVNVRCEKGLYYLDARVDDASDEATYCCLGQNDRCAEREFPTEAELAAEEKAFNEHFERCKTARGAIVAAAGPWKKGVELHGELACPVCKIGWLRWRRSGRNGHIHALCTTDGCAGWME